MSDLAAWLLAQIERECDEVGSAFRQLGSVIRERMGR